MTKELFFTGADGVGYAVSVTDVPFEVDGLKRLKFEVKDIFSVSFVQRLEGDEWVILEGDMLPEHLPSLGRVVRANFDT